MSEADRDAAGRGALRTALLGAGGDLPHLELNASRTAARTDATGEPILMLEQNRALWDQIQIRRGMQALERARQLGGADGSYTLQAAIIACHSEAESAADTDWSRIAGLYAQLVVVVPTCCRAFEVTYSTGSGVTKKPVPHSNRPRLWPATSANLAC